MPCNFSVSGSETFTKLCKTDAVAKYGHLATLAPGHNAAEVAEIGFRVP